MPISTRDHAQAMAAAFNAGDMEQVVALGASAGGPMDDGLRVLLGLAQQASGRHRDAAATFHRLTRSHPDVSAYWNNLGVARRQAGDLASSEEALLTARSLAPHDADVAYNLGLLHMQQRRWPLARQTLMDAVQKSPGFIEARLQAAHACHVCGDSAGQEALLEGAAEWPPQEAETAMLLAAMLATHGRMDAALHTLSLARLPAAGVEADVLRLRMAAQRSALHERSNRIDDARAELHDLPPALLDALPPSAHRARAEGWIAHAALAMRGVDPAHAAALYRQVLPLAVDPDLRTSAAFGLAAACDRLGQQAEAWKALQQAHALQLEAAREVVPELLAHDSRPLAMNGAAHARVDAAGWKPLSAPDRNDSPVFVVGFPRSGTTLLEQMLDAHPDFRSMDERAFIHELIERMEQVGQPYPAGLADLTQHETDQLRASYARMTWRVLPDLGAHRLVDKNPLNMLCLPMIMRLFPRARIILCLRHPCDVLLSCYMQPFRSPAFMVLCSSLRRLALGYVQAFEQWQRHVELFAPDVLEWRYESVVGDFDEHVARLGRFLDLADATPMARFAEHAGRKPFISTPSYAQVTQGIHRSAVDRWHAYREQFEDVLPLLQPLIDRLGYTA